MQWIQRIAEGYMNAARHNFDFPQQRERNPSNAINRLLYNNLIMENWNDSFDPFVGDPILKLWYGKYLWFPSLIPPNDAQMINDTQTSIVT